MKKPIKKVIPKIRKKPIGKEIVDAVIEESENNDDISILDYDDGSMLLVKRHTVNVKRIRNSDYACMQPMEDYQEKTFFHLFMIYWDAKKINKEHVSLEYGIGFPAIHVKTVYGALDSIDNQ